MPSDFVTNIIRRSNRNLLLWSLLGIIAVAVGVILGLNYLQNFIQGPYTVDKQEILNIKDLGSQQKTFITLKGDDMVDTGYYHYTQKKGSSVENVDAYYGALLLEDRYLLVKTGQKVDEKTTTYTGGLVAMSSKEQSQIIGDIEQENPDLKGVFLPYMLDTGDFRTPGYIGLAVGGVVLLLSLFGLSRFAGRSNPLNHPIMKRLAKFGDAEQVASQIDMEMSGDHPKAGNAHFTRSWLVQATGASLNATRFNDIMWVYKKITQHRTNGIPTGKTYSVLIWDRYGQCITINAKENVINEVIDATLNRAPGAIGGFNKEIETMWNKNRDQFITTVDGRARQARGQAQPQAIATT
jgi:hypothetical protein